MSLRSKSLMEASDSGAFAAPFVAYYVISRFLPIFENDVEPPYKARRYRATKPAE